jgi:hypothetical protein
VVCIIPFGHGMATGAGALQGVLALPARWAVKLPDSPAPEGSLQNPLRDTAGLFLAGITAYIQVKECDLQRGQKVLVVGASGGVGHMAVQLAREKVGKEGLVVGVCSGRNEELVNGLGANEVGLCVVVFTFSSAEQNMDIRMWWLSCLPFSQPFVYYVPPSPESSLDPWPNVPDSKPSQLPCMYIADLGD